MHLKGKHQFKASAGVLWEMLMDPDTLSRVTPGISRLEETDTDTYDAIADVKMGPVRGTFKGQMEVRDKDPTSAFLLKVKQDSRIGNVSADVKIMLEEVGEDETEMSFEGDARLSGLLARTGNRVLSGVANTLTKQFFQAMEDEIEARTTSA